METFTGYFLKSAVWITGFTFVYFLFLRNERYFLLKRYYLITGILISFIFPLFTFHYQVEMPAAVTQTAGFIPVDSVQTETVSTANHENVFNYQYILLILYLSGILFFLFRLIRHIGSLLKTINKADKSRLNNAKVIRTSELTGSFSFFNYVFINPSLNETESEMIMNHELVHVNQKHWFDLLLVEMLRVFQWINPFAWIYSGFIRQNHEYIADEVALQHTTHPAIYKAVLVNQLFDSRILSLSNSFNYSLNKKRFDMMKKIVASPYRKIKILLVLPLFAIVFFAFAKPEYNYSSPPESMIQDQPVATVAQKEARGVVVQEDGKPLPGVTVVVSNSSIGVMTDAGGKFAIDKVPDGSSLIFSCKGYKTHIMPPLMTTNLNLYIKLVKDPEYKSEVEIRSTDGSMVNALVVRDGVISDEDVRKIDPASVYSMTVLKGQAAIDKYGEKGEKGVIEITTRKEPALTPDSKPLVLIKGGDKQQRPNPLVVIDGIITDKKYPDVIKELGYNMGIQKNLFGKDAFDKYGDKGNNGVVEITTRNKALEMGLNPPYPRLGPHDFPTFEGKDHLLFNDWVRERLQYPSEARMKNIEGFVSVSFVIQVDGTIDNIKVSPGSDPLLADEVIRVIRTSPKWDPPKNTEIKEPLNMSVIAGFRLPDEIVKQMPFVVVEEMPMYPGGEKELLDFIKNNTKYPESARANGISGRVIVRFIVNTQGNTEGATVLKGVDPLLDAEALRVIKLLKGFKPGMQGGKEVDVWYMVPVNFELTETK